MLMKKVFRKTSFNRRSRLLFCLDEYLSCFIFNDTSTRLDQLEFWEDSIVRNQMVGLSNSVTWRHQS